ncbi:MAG: LysR family transcriptional regulator [Betaproteobacteria bacterium]|nr:LysR family transcriptional regulator [Betaproteobacteria bacterium]
MPSRQDAWFIRVRLKPRQLLLLVAIDELGNIHKAADELGMTQPAASKLLKELESALEVTLFDRLPRGMRPTWYGEIMIRHARMTLANLGIAYDEITALKAGLSGQVAVGCIMPAGTALFPLTIARLKSHYPLLQIRVELDSSDALLAQLTDSKLDIVVARLFEHHDKSAFNFEPLAEESICVAARRGHPLTRKRKLQLRDLADLSWILPTGKVIRHRFDMVFRGLGLAPPQNIVITPALPVTISLLQHADMVAAVPNEVVQHYREHGMLDRVPIDFPLKMDAYGIITRRNRLLSPAAQIMLKTLRATASELY